jgi:16S rRNA processing protein RimM
MNTGDPSRSAARVCVGAVTGARGLKGEVRIKSFTAEPEDVAAYGPVMDKSGKRTFRVRVTGRARDQVIARIEGVDDRDAAEALKGTGLYVLRSALPEAEAGTYYHADLIGIEVQTGAGERLGKVKAVHNFGAGDVIEVAATGRSVMVPFTDKVVTAVNVTKGLIVVDPPKGLLENSNPGKTEES